MKNYVNLLFRKVILASFVGVFGLNLIAQEVEEVIPEIVKETDDGIKTVDYGRMVCVLIESIKELNAKVKILEGKS